MSFKNIQIALDTRLSELPGVTPVAWENVQYTPILGRPWIRPTLINGDSSLNCLSDWNQNNPGIYRVDVFYPTGNGTGQLLDKLDSIYTHFKAEPNLDAWGTRVIIKQVSILQRIVEETSWFMGSLNINFACYN